MLQSADARYYHSITDNGQPVFNLTPVRGSTQLSTLPAYFLSSEALSAQNSQRLLLVQVGADLSAAPALEVRACAGMLPYTLPPDVRQRGTTVTLSRNDARVMSAFQHNQRIHFVLNALHPSGPPRAGICYGQITNLTAPTPSAQAQFLPEAREAAFPAIAYCGRTPTENSALIVYSHAAPTEYVGYSAVFVDDAGDLSAPVNLHTGDDYIAIWGDYLGLSPRYNRPGEVWAQGCVPVATGLGGAGSDAPYFAARPPGRGGRHPPGWGAAAASGVSEPGHRVRGGGISAETRRPDPYFFAGPARANRSGIAARLGARGPYNVAICHDFAARRPVRAASGKPARKAANPPLGSA
ncbi:hypothetical protein MUN86_29965 (plasmid) [Hymenobacter volaticus]|uniref:IgGFc-binding protein N-terminal domain-containing protein n=1 Tax=Hymenobacter volaticus TaxID=2932254 RepID=A0ABY4GG03_9BACT|nr:hypothetical protein [Hymenobacter volaticus]UOQ69740.1 hypothetical protein MUN86_29965 [Hymenobacter volaticus]